MCASEKKDAKLKESLDIVDEEEEETKVKGKRKRGGDSDSDDVQVVAAKAPRRGKPPGNGGLKTQSQMSDEEEDVEEDSEEVSAPFFSIYQCGEDTETAFRSSVKIVQVCQEEKVEEETDEEEETEEQKAEREEFSYKLHVERMLVFNDATEEFIEEMNYFESIRKQNGFYTRWGIHGEGIRMDAFPNQQEYPTLLPDSNIGYFDGCHCCSLFILSCSIEAPGTWLDVWKACEEVCCTRRDDGLSSIIEGISLSTHPHSSVKSRVHIGS